MGFRWMKRNAEEGRSRREAQRGNCGEGCDPLCSRRERPIGGGKEKARLLGQPGFGVDDWEDGDR